MRIVFYAIFMPTDTSSIQFYELKNFLFGFCSETLLYIHTTEEIVVCYVFIFSLH